MWLFHRHRFVEVERLPMGLHTRFIDGYEDDSPVTLITERCVDNTCRKWRQIRLDGWINIPKEKTEGFIIPGQEGKV